MRNYKGDAYYYLSIAFIVILVIANIASTRLFHIAGFMLDAGTLLFPSIYILNNIITEIYGFHASRRVVLLGFLSSSLSSLFLYACIFLPGKDDESYTYIFSLSCKIFIASAISYLIGELLNSYLLTQLKNKYQGKYFIFRAILSTSIGASIESTIFCYIAFSEMLCSDELYKMTLLLIFVKIAYEIVLMPITVWLVGLLKK